MIENEKDVAIRSVEVEIALSGNIESQVEIKDMLDIDVFSTKVSGRVGSPIEFRCEEDFDFAKVVFNYNEELLGATNEEDLIVLWYDEEHGVYIAQKQAIINTEENTITVELSHFSTYVIVDGLLWLDVPIINSFKFDSCAGSIDYYVAIDMSSAMTSRGLEEAKAVLNDIGSSYFSSGDRLTVLWFNNYNYGKFDYFATEEDIEYFVEEMCEQIDYYGSIGGAYGSYEMAARGASKMANMFPSSNKGELIIITNDTDPMVSRNDVLVWTQSNNIDITSVIVDNGTGLGATGLGDIYFFNGNSTFDEMFRGIDREMTISYPTGIDLTIDSDGDGVPDFIELNVNLTNGNSITTDPNCNDTDGDGISDGEELGVIYELMRGANGQYVEVRLNGVTVYSSVLGGIADSSQYSFLNDYLPGPGSVNFIVVSESDPRMPDSDNDGFMDNEDGNPLKVNRDMIYLFCNSDFYDNAQCHKSLYEDAGYDVCLYMFVNTTTFDYAWNGIGLSEEYYLYKETGESTDKYYYNPKYVVIMTHGNTDRLMLGANNNDPEYLEMGTNHFSNLKKKKIESLNLYACLTGYGESCIADAFFNNTGIKKVIAPDTWIWGIKARYYFIGYSSDPNISSIFYYNSEEDYLEFKNTINHELFTLYGWAMNVHDIDCFLNPEGFLLFSGEGIRDSIYSNDVFWGDLHRYEYTDSEGNRHGEGVIVVPSYLRENYGYIYNDPILN